MIGYKKVIKEKIEIKLNKPNVFKYHSSGKKLLKANRFTFLV